MALTIPLVVVCTLLAVGGSWCLHGLLWYYRASTRPKNFPPGPKTLPFLGHLHIFPPTKSFLKFHEWGKQYGSIIGLKLGPWNVVVLNDYKHVQELYDKRGAIYSSRPPSHIANDLIYQNKTHILFLPYGDDWRAIRKTTVDLLKSNIVESILPIQKAESTATLHQMLHDPKDWYDQICRYTSAIILASVFGLRGAHFDSPRVKDLYHVQHQQIKINELGATPPVDIFPFLKSLPDFMSPWRKWARKIRKEHREFYFSLMDQSQANLKTPNAPHCFMPRLMELGAKQGLDDEHIAYLAGVIMEAGSDTTAGILLSFVIAMAKNPEVLLKCQKEVDRLCGTERTPGAEDFDSMPYIRAVMNETLRWRPIAPAGVPHASLKDDTYEGYFFPKGTIFFANAWSIHRTDEYDAPDDFIPERFLDNKFGINPDRMTDDLDKRRTQYQFGAGRRVCAGQPLAENSMMMIMAKITWAFNIEPAAAYLSDSMDDAYEGGILAFPKKAPVKFTPRSPVHADVIEREYQAELPFLNRFGV